MNFEIEMKSLSDLIPYAKNPRKNSSAVKNVAKSILEFGFRQPIVVDENNVVVVGHTRLKAAIKLKLNLVPVHIARGLSEAQKKAYRIIDNKSNETAQWDNDLLDNEIAALLAENYSLELIVPPESKDMRGSGDNDILSENYDVLVSLKNEEEQKHFYKKTIDEGYKCRVLIL